MLYRCVRCGKMHESEEGSCDCWNKEAIEHIKQFERIKADHQAEKTLQWCLQKYHICGDTVYLQKMGRIIRVKREEAFLPRTRREFRIKKMIQALIEQLRIIDLRKVLH